MMTWLIDAWRQRTRRLRGEDLREYKAGWAEWHAKYDRYRTRDGKHFLNSISEGWLLCGCNAEFYNGTEPELLAVFQEHLDENQPVHIDVAALLARRTA